MSACSTVMEFYGIKIPIEDIMAQKILDIMQHCDAEEECLLDYINLELNKLIRDNNLYGVYMFMHVGYNNNYYILLGNRLKYSSKDVDFTEVEIDITVNPTLSNDVLGKMKKLHELFEVNKPFESYELVHKIYHTAHAN